MNIIKSIIKCKCPRCHKGNLFIAPFSISDPLKMPKYCQECELNFEPEPGFYWGAMFLSYGFYAITVTPFALLLVFGFGWSANASMAFVIIFTLLTFLKMARLARSIWIHIATRPGNS